MCNLITYSLALLNVKIVSENSKFTTFDQSNVFLDWSKKLKISYQTIYLARLVLDRCSIDWKSIDRKRTFDRSTSNRIKQKVHVSLDRSKVIFDQSKNVKLEFSRIFLKQFSMVFMKKLPSYEHNGLILRLELNSIDAIALKFNLTYLISNLNNIITSISVFH